MSTHVVIVSMLEKNTLFLLENSLIHFVFWRDIVHAFQYNVYSIVNIHI